MSKSSDEPAARRPPDPRPELVALREGVVGLGDRLAGVAAGLEKAVSEAMGEAVLASRDRALKQALEAAVGSLRSEIAPHLETLGRGVDEIAQRTSEAALDARMASAVARVPETRLREVVAPELSTVQSKIAELEDAYEHADDVLARLRSWIDAFDPGGAAVLSQKVERLEAELDGTNGRLEAQQEENRRLRQVVDEKEDALRRIGLVEGRWSPDELLRREEELAKAAEDVEARQALEVQVSRLTKERADLEAELARHQAAHRSHIDQLENLQLIDKLKDAAEQERLRADDEARRRRHAEARSRRVGQELDAAQVQLAELDAERALLETRQRHLDQLQRSVNDLEARLADLQVGREADRQARVAAERARDEAVAAAEAELERRVAVVREAHAQRVENDAAARASEHVDRATHLEGMLAESRDRAAELESRLRALQDARQEAEAAKTRIAALEAELHAHGETVRASLKEQQDRVAADLAAERSRLQARADDVDAQVAQAEEDLATARREHEQLAGQIGVATQTLADLEDRIQRARGEDVPDAERLRQLHSPVFEPSDLGTTYSPDDEWSWLREIEGALQDAGFSFDPRLVRAFHTSLKIAEQAPLSVLAGISGTGKSELPRLYAGLAGIPFLSLPVQPSWDSPMDLFGFFNYTDGRLKAEPLARLLHQMGQAEDPLRQGLSLVLLDEMNLARVEYYFADLLSRLESRRGLGDDAPAADRALATIPLDAGPGASAVPLFLDRRVLFVGTMNEDESTLTLSDKVLDRASVITFPAPREMSLRRQERPTPRTERLAQTAWQGWIRTAREDDDLSRRLNEVNDLMASMGRPFGHRLFRAIHAYLTNYPGVAQGHPDRTRLLDDAWSDQFAMKILPRLKGLEVADDRVARGLDGLARLERFPDDLREAFDTARGHEFFHWQGARDARTETT